MTSTRRSLLIFGVVFAVLALVAPEPGFAQVPGTPTDVAATTVDFDSIKVIWTHADDNAASWEIVYQQVDGTGFDFTDGLTKLMSVSDEDAVDATVNGLTHKKRYVFTVRGVDEDGGRGTASQANAASTAMTDMAPAPDRVTGVTATGGDMTFMVEWNAGHAGGGGLSIESYMVQKREVSGSLRGEWVPEEPKEVDGDTTMFVFEDLDNGVTYQARVMAVNSADVDGPWSLASDTSLGSETAMTGEGMDDDDDDDPMETPALPIAGILALGAGLLAAGRRRLRL